MEQKLYIVTVATENKYYMNYLIESVKKNNGELIILGFGEKWKGFNWKYKLVLDFLWNLNNYDIVCFVDAYDVICVRDLNLLIENFYKIKKRENCKIIVGSEKHLNIYNKISSIMLFSTCKGYSLNSGTYICEVINLKKILNYILKNNQLDKSDDQVLLTNYCNENIYDIYIDINNELFLTTIDTFNELNMDDKIYDNELIYDNNKPFFIHSAGSTCMGNLIEKLGYDIDKNIICSKITEKVNFDLIQHYNLILFDSYGLYVLIIIIFIYIYYKIIYKNNI